MYWVIVTLVMFFQLELTQVIYQFREQPSGVVYTPDSQQSATGQSHLGGFQQKNNNPQIFRASGRCQRKLSGIKQ